MKYMSSNIVDELTLEYLMNRSQYQKYMNRKTPQKLSNKKDVKFYRKRILALTKELLYPDDRENRNCCSNVDKCYETYIHACIEYFKTLDKSDIIQQDYVNMDDPILQNNIDEIKSQSYADDLFMRTIKVQPTTTLDNFVTRNKVVKEDVILPIQKDINLKDPELKNKGIKNKKDGDERKKKKKKKKNDHEKPKENIA